MQTNFRCFRLDFGLDWSGGSSAVAGAESDYYQGLAVPYYAKEAPMDDLSELLLVRGILDHPEIYWGGAATNHEPAQFQHKLGFGTAPGQIPALSVEFEELFHAVFHRENQHQHRRYKRPANDSQRDNIIAETIVNNAPGPDGVDGTADDMPY